MLARTTRITLEVAAAALALVLLAGGVAIWRLASAPVNVEFLTPYLERALSDSEGGMSVEVAETVLVWQAQSHRVNLLARDLVIRDRDGALVGALPEAAVGLSLRALVQGVVAPTTIEARGVALTLTRRVDGSFAVGSGATQPDSGSEDAATDVAGEIGRILPLVLKQLSAPPDPDDPVSFLRAVRISDGRVLLRDERLRVTWAAPDADIEIRRGPGGVTGEVSFTLDLGETPARFELAFVHEAATGLSDFAGRFDDLRTAPVIAASPALEPFAGIDLSLSGNVWARLDKDARLTSVSLEAASGPGSFGHAGLLPNPLPVKSADLAARFVLGEGITLERAQIDFGGDKQQGPKVSLSGQVAGFDVVNLGAVAISGEGEVTGMPAELLERYWPKAVATNARAWVVPNIPTGSVETARAKFALDIDGEGAATLRELDGSFSFRDLAVHYLKPLPPVEGIAGSARFDADKIHFDASAGHLGSLTVRSGAVDILDLQKDLSRMTISVAVDGPVPNALTLLDHPRLDLLKGLGIDPTATGGTASVDLDLAFPLPKELEFEQIALSAKAKLENASAKRILFDQDVTDGTLELVVDREGMTVTGPATYAGIPLEAEWREEFTDKVAYSSRLSAKVPRMVDDDWRRFGIEPASLLSGPVSGAVVVTARSDGSGEISAALDLREASVKISPLLWKKPEGKSGKADLLVTWRPGHPLAIPSLELDAGTLYARGRATLAAESNELALLELDRLAYEGTDLQGLSVEWLEPGYKVRIVGGVLDLAPFLEEEEEPATGETAPQPEPAAEEPEEPFDFEAPQLVRLTVGPDRYLEGVSLALKRNPKGWDKIAIKGDVPQVLWSKAPALPPDALPADRRRFSFELLPDGSGGHSLSSHADDLGAVLRALDLIDTLHGGRMDITGQSDPAVPDGPVKGRIEAKDYVLVDAPVMAKLLTLASLRGISDTLGGEGIRFDRLIGDFTLQDGKVETDLVRAYGAALGLTAEGSIDIDGNAVDLQGTVVPAYTINRVIGAIPLVGDLLTGGEGEGVVAFTYKASGPLDDPQVSVNPLSALAPGFLRNLFGIFSGEGGDPPSERLQAVPPRDM